MSFCISNQSPITICTLCYRFSIYRYDPDQMGKPWMQEYLIDLKQCGTHCRLQICF